MQSRATFVYLLMLGLFGVGLWIIVSYGTIKLRAPEDLAGQWELFELGAALDDEPLLSMTVEQSGKFFKLHAGDRPMDLKLSEETRFLEGAQRRVRLRLVGGGAAATFVGRRGGDEFEVRFEGPLRGSWLARRTHRTHVPNAKADVAHVPSTALPHARR